jgi:hypothetical protein
MISRIWHGWTTSQNADKYKALLKEEVFIPFPQINQSIFPNSLSKASICKPVRSIKSR